ncbi:uncharacterized protein LOC125047016 [Penaeus chinensis]|uniref:uncharacterized protein LOC125047016 n=1 Tax=Penaeus chinensis TaxID=139456 RepID=UPI001FB667EF|nr:uncharacterized protein LOC125047016 [Penaeus chinensis]
MAQVFSPALHNRNTQRPVTLPGGGRLFLGQRSPGGSTWNSLRGEMAEFRLYNTSLPRDKVQEYVSCREMNTSSEPLLSFDNLTDFTINSKGIFGSVSRGALCQRKPYRLHLISIPYSFEESRRVCKMHGGRLATAPSAEEIQLITEQFSEFRPQCATPRGTFYWLGLQFDHTTKAWLDVTTLSPVPPRDSSDASEPTFPCATAGIPLSPSWHSINCDALSCPLCNVSSHGRLLLRGLCKESTFDRSFSAYGYHNGKPAFEGFQNSRLVWDNATWVLSTRFSRGTTARLNSSLSSRSPPFGYKFWSIEGDNCGQSKAALLLTPCAEGQFTCSDFACIPIALRCDRSYDCADNSDEHDCQKVLFSDGYSKSISPPNMNASQPLNLNLTFVITTIREFSVVGFRMSLDGVLRCTWRDARLNFANLHGNFMLNDIKKEDVWRPSISISDGTESIVKPEILKEFLYVVREGEPLPPDTSRLKEDVLYRGSENTIVLNYAVRIEAMCIFQLHNYPFDKQKCQLRFSYYDNADISVLQKGGVTMEATRELLEYEIISETMTDGATKPFMSSIQVEIEFQNQYTFYITNVIVPTLLMAIICYLTFYFQLNDFQDRIVISLTSMLVLATLFTQMSQSIPKTAYFKVIDGWFMCLIVIDFFVVVIHTIIENLCGMRASSLNKSVKHSPPQVAWSSHEQNNIKGFIIAQKVNVASQIIFPFLITLMCTIFAILGYSSLYMTP